MHSTNDENSKSKNSLKLSKSKTNLKSPFSP